MFHTCSIDSLQTTVPTGYPQGFQVQPVTSRAVVAQWEPPFISDRNGVILNYTVRWSLAATGAVNEHTTAATNITVSDLNPHTTYVWIIAASTSIGTGPYSTAVNVLMPEEGI